MQLSFNKAYRLEVKLTLACSEHRRGLHPDVTLYVINVYAADAAIDTAKAEVTEWEAEFDILPVTEFRTLKAEPVDTVPVPAVIIVARKNTMKGTVKEKQ